MSDLTAMQRQEISRVARMWWLWLVTGVLWVLISLVVLQFDDASVATVGYIVGAMFFFSGISQFVIAGSVEGWKWVWVVFGILFIGAGLWAMFNPGTTVAALADSLGFLFLLVAILWTIEAFATRRDNDLWWMSLIAAVIMYGVAFWTSGQFFVERVYTLLVFAGVWALMQGITDFVRAFQIRKLGRLVAR